MRRVRRREVLVALSAAGLSRLIVPTRALAASNAIDAPVEVARQTIPSGRFAKVTRGNDLEFTGVDLDLVRLVPADFSSNVWVYADVIRINAKLRFPGANVTLVARVIEASDAAEIDTSGREVTALAGAPKGQAGSSPGAGGEPGQDGAAGESGGNITITAREITGLLILKANGGPGAVGQNGGAGAIGAAGAAGVDCSAPMDGMCAGAVGNQGSVGGTGGPGGRGGAGGHSGQIRVRTLVASDQRVRITAQAGRGGAGGPGGRGALGGPGGVGGQGEEHEFSGHEGGSRARFR